MSLTLDIERALKAESVDALQPVFAELAVYNSEDAYDDAQALTVLISYRQSTWSHVGVCNLGWREMTFLVEVSNAVGESVHSALRLLRAALHQNDTVIHPTLGRPLLKEEVVERIKDGGLFVGQQLYQLDFVGEE